MARDIAREDDEIDESDIDDFETAELIPRFVTLLFVVWPTFHKLNLHFCLTGLRWVWTRECKKICASTERIVSSIRCVFVAFEKRVERCAFDSKSNLAQVGKYIAFSTVSTRDMSFLTTPMDVIGIHCLTVCPNRRYLAVAEQISRSRCPQVS